MEKTVLHKNKKMRKLLFLILGLILIEKCMSLWSGPLSTRSHCDGMRPRHGIEQTPESSPYKIIYDVKRRENKPNIVLVNITTKLKTPFAGFFVQVRAIFDYKQEEKEKKDWELYGDWRCKSKNTKTLDCHDEINVCINCKL